MELFSPDLILVLQAVNRNYCLVSEDGKFEVYGCKKFEPTFYLYLSLRNGWEQTKNSISITWHLFSKLHNAPVVAHITKEATMIISEF